MNIHPLVRLRAGFARLGTLTIGRLLKWLLWTSLSLSVVALAGFAWFVGWPVHTVPALEKVDEQLYLGQNWGPDQHSAARQTYYYTPQGTSMPQGASAGAVRYSWFVHLERALSDQRFADPEHMRQYRFLVDPTPSAANPDLLPVGFTKHFDPAIGEDVLDITCAACHTGELQYTKNGKTTALRVDGGQAMHAFTDMDRGSFAPQLMAALLNTAVSPWKFDRFAQKVLGEAHPASKPELKTALWATVKAMLATGQNNPLRHLYPIREGYGRTDALGRIGNTAFGDHLSADNYQVGAAPVSYPYLWNIWKFDWVQYNGSVAQPLARNIGEALGVGAISPLHTAMNAPLPADQRFRSSVNIAGLQQIEHKLQTLTPPVWPEAVFGAIDQAKAGQGRELFEKHCQGCHGPHIASAARQQASAPGKPMPGLEWRIEVIPLAHIGTDPAAAKSFIARHYDLRRTGLTNADLLAALQPLQQRQLARDARFRLTEVIELRTAAGLPVGELPTLLAAYPDPDASATVELPVDSFSQIDQELTLLLPDYQTPSLAPEDALDCTLDCQTAMLVWDLRAASAANARTLAALDVAKLNEGLALNVLGILLKNRFYADNGIDYATQQCLEGYGAIDLPKVVEGYKPRPLAGIWATPPFLHNGSVPSLYQMLLPPAQREARFFVGRREFDPVHVGYVSTPAEGGGDNGFWLDTSIPGNHNSGHAFAASKADWALHEQDPKAHPLPDGVIGPEFTKDERLALVEYLKIHRDPDTPVGFEPQFCQLLGQTL